MPAKSTNNNRLIDALALLEALSAAGTAGISAENFMNEQGIKADELAQACDIIAMLADRESGARARVDERAGRLFLAGADGRISPLRLSLSEGLVLAHMIETATIDTETKRSIEAALLPFGADADLRDSISSTSSPAPWIAAVTEVIAFGIRTELNYRSSSDDAPRVRTVDPQRVEVRAGSTYLVAWDIDKDEQRYYRFDRIIDMRKTDESVVVHEHNQDENENSGFGLAGKGRLVQVSLPTSAAGYITWAGIAKRSVRKADPDRTILSVHVASDTWLFQQILASGGSIKIENDPELAEAFQNWARELKI